MTTMRMFGAALLAGALAAGVALSPPGAMAGCSTGQNGSEAAPARSGGIDKSCVCGTCNWCWSCHASGTNAQYPAGRLNAGNCVWYAWNRRCDAGQAFPACRDAQFWDNDADTYNIPVSNCPRVGAIGVYESGTYGHVGLVTAFNGDNVWNDEQGCGYCGTSTGVSRARTYWDHYIYMSGESLASTKFVVNDWMAATGNVKVYSDRRLNASFVTVAKGTSGQIIAGDNNGDCTPTYEESSGSVANAFRLWKVKFEGFDAGWAPEDWMEKTIPVVNAFAAGPTQANFGSPVTVTFTVTDDVDLATVQLYRSDDTAGVPSREINTLAVSGKTHTGSFSDTPPAAGTYHYGIHVTDKENNWNDEQNSRTGHSPGDFGPAEVTVRVFEAEYAPVMLIDKDCNYRPCALNFDGNLNLVGQKAAYDGANPRPPATVYAHATATKDRDGEDGTAFDYWFYYPWNAHPMGQNFDHDWEHVVVFVPVLGGAPKHVTFHHLLDFMTEWQRPWSGCEKDGNHVKLNVMNDGHEPYPDYAGPLRYFEPPAGPWYSGPLIWLDWDPETIGAADWAVVSMRQKTSETETHFGLTYYRWDVLQGSGSSFSPGTGLFADVMPDDPSTNLLNLGALETASFARPSAPWVRSLWNEPYGAASLSIGDVRVSLENSANATIAWVTSRLGEPVHAGGMVEYGTTPGYGSSTPYDETLSIEHAVSVTGLTEGAVYHYRIISRDESGNLTISEDRTFTALPGVTDVIPSLGARETSAPQEFTVAVSPDVERGKNLRADISMSAKYVYFNGDTPKIGTVTASLPIYVHVPAEAEPPGPCRGVNVNPQSLSLNVDVRDNASYPEITYSQSTPLKLTNATADTMLLSSVMDYSDELVVQMMENYPNNPIFWASGFSSSTLVPAAVAELEVGGILANLESQVRSALSDEEAPDIAGAAIAFVSYCRSYGWEAHLIPIAVRYLHSTTGGGTSYTGPGWWPTWSIPPEEVQGVHERVKLVIPQEATLERDAFNALLEIKNLTADELKDVEVEIMLKDPAGNLANELFYNRVTDVHTDAAP